MDEILIKSKDGKWHILKGEEILPYEELADYGLRTTDYGLRTTDYGLPTTDYGLRTTDYGLPTKDYIIHEEHPLRTELDEIIDRVTTEAAGDWDEILRKRFHRIVSARLRDVRDAIETRQMLTRPVKVGGMGLKTLEHGNMVTLVDDVVVVIEKAFGEFQGKWKEVERKKIEDWKKKQAEEQERKQVEAEKKEKEELEKQYSRLTGVSSKLQITNSKQIPISKTQIPKPLIKPVPPPPIQKTENRKQKTEIAQQIRPPSSVLCPPSKITDVRPAPRRIGHIEELGTITLDDLRRLPGATAMDKVGKIGSKIEFLGQESLSQRAKGIAAWRQSPLSQMYNNVLKQAMSRRVGPETILKENPGSLTIDEFHGIMELNQKLRF